MIDVNIETNEGLAARLTELANGLGFTRVAFIKYEDAPMLPNLRPPDLPFTPRTLAVLLMPAIQAEFGEHQAKVDGYYFTSNKAHHALDEWMKQARALGVECAKPRGVSAKAAAADAGLGIIRRNTLLYADGMGSRLAIQLAALSADLPTAPLCRKGEADFNVDACHGCANCVAACPTRALDGRGHMDRPRCIRQHQMKATPVPLEMRGHMTTLIGCGICQRVCPAQREAETVNYANNHLYDIDNLLSLTAESIENYDALIDTSLAPADSIADNPAFSALANLGKQIGVNLAVADRIVAQTALIAGNSGDAGYIDKLRPLLSHESEDVREHAAWAIAKLETGVGTKGAGDTDAQAR